VDDCVTSADACQVRALLVAAVAAVAVFMLGAPAYAATTLDSVGSAPPAPAGATGAGALDPATPLHLDVVLGSRDPAGLQSFIEAVSDPTSPLYRRYLARGQFASTFGATPAAIASVRAALRKAGLSPGAPSTGGLTIPVDTTVAEARSALHVRFARYRLRSGRVAFANRSAPLVPGSIAGRVRAIAGLDNLARPEPHLVRSKPRAVRTRPRIAAAQPAAAAPQACSAASNAASLFGAYTPAQLATAYGLDGLYGIGAQGAGVRVALYELEPNSSSDINTFQSCFGTSTSISFVNVDGGAGNGTGVGEAALDIEGIVGLAPQAAITVYRGPNNGTGGPLHTYQRIVADDTAQVISTSWGLCDPQMSSAEANAENTAFMQGAAQGQTIVAASGDDGSEDCQSSNTLAADDPASQPFVTGVGGTTLQTTPSRTETVWNGSSGAGGGGHSSRWAVPSYQSSFVTSGNRGVPDVAADADPDTGYVVRYNGAWTAFGGTSAAAPLWGAIVAAADSSGLGTCTPTAPAGFLNPALYSIAAGAGYAAAFNDITTGDNDFTGTNSGSYGAATGYDLASGLGTPIAYTSPTAGLVPALCGGPGAPAVGGLSPASGAEAGGDTVTITGTNLDVATASVDFGGVPATAVEQVTNTRITAVAPAGTGTVPVTVSDTYGTSSPADYVYAAPAPAPSPSGTTTTNGGAQGSSGTAPTGTSTTGTSTGSNPAPATPTKTSTRSLVVTITGALRYRLRRAVAPGVLHVSADSRGNPTRISGRATVSGATGGSATIVYSLRKHGRRWTGHVRVVDRASHVVQTFAISASPALAASGRVTAKGRATLHRHAAKLQLTFGPVVTR
jgi:subtilase family serine protease